MGRLTLNVLLSFAQFEREVTGERIRDKIASVIAQRAAAKSASLADFLEEIVRASVRRARPAPARCSHRLPASPRQRKKKAQATPMLI
jgi:hypothetical protein